MKKALSLILAILMLFALMSAAFAEESGWTCTNGHDNPAGNLFCGKCGEKRKTPSSSWVCPNGHENPADNNFCSTCGAKRGAVAPAAAPAATPAPSYDWLDAFLNKDYDEAFYDIKADADSGSAEAAYYLGLCYEHGYGISQDYSRAMEAYQKAASGNNTPALTRIGAHL